jgi:hypothetical protein
MKLTVYCLVSGDHTRTVQIAATPTVGGLMKFGCKTSLRGKEASAYMTVISLWEHTFNDKFVRWCRMQKLQT